MQSLTAAEHETTITSTDADDTVHIWTCQRRYLGRLRRDRRFTQIATGRHGRTEWAEFTIAADQWNPVTGAKRASKALSPQQRQEAAKNLRKQPKTGAQNTWGPGA